MTLFDEPHVAVRRDAQLTSAAAAVNAYPSSGTQRLTVFRYIAKQGEHGAIDEEMQAGLHMGHNSQTWATTPRLLVGASWCWADGLRTAVDADALRLLAATPSSGYSRSRAVPRGRHSNDAVQLLRRGRGTPPGSARRALVGTSHGAA